MPNLIVARCFVECVDVALIGTGNIRVVHRRALPWRRSHSSATAPIVLGGAVLIHYMKSRSKLKSAPHSACRGGGCPASFGNSGEEPLASVARDNAPGARSLSVGPKPPRHFGWRVVHLQYRRSAGVSHGGGDLSATRALDRIASGDRQGRSPHP